MISGAGGTDPGPDGQAVAVEHAVARLRERLYGAISCLATLAVLARYTSADTNAWSRVLDVAVATGGLWAASLLADWVAHLGVRLRVPIEQTALRMLRSSGQILEAALVPLLVLVVAGIGWLHTDIALWIAMWVLVAEPWHHRVSRRTQSPLALVAEDFRRHRAGGGRRTCRCRQDARTLTLR
jgi:hypothetical protein